MDQVKLTGIAEWPTPKNKKDIQLFLGFCNFYRHFIEGFAKYAKPLTSLVGNVNFKWGEEQENAFQTLKNRLILSPILQIPNDEGHFKPETDASDYAVGAVLSQKQKDREGNLHYFPVGYMSKALDATQRNWQIYDKEMFAIISGLEEWRSLLIGSKPFDIHTNHHNLTYYKSSQTLSQKQARWATMLQEYNYTLHYKEGKKMTLADVLSRRPDHQLVEKDNQNSIVIPPHRIATLETNLTPSGNPDYIMNSSRESEVEEGIEDMSLNAEQYYAKHKQAITNILAAFHDSPMGGHSGVAKTLEKVKTNGYDFLHSKEIIKKYIERCAECQRAKIFPRKPFGLLKPTEIPDEPWKHIMVDLITRLPESQGHNAILVVVDKFSKMAHYVPIRKE